jgi:outer membrane lipoprotein-sorting protein
VKKILSTILTLAALLAFLPAPALAQTADEIVERHLAATGGREALSKLQSRTASGSITLSTPVGELTGTIDVFAKVPNKSRALVKLDLTALGAGQVVSDQRFDGTSGYVIDTFNGNRDVTGSQLDAMRNGIFPTPLLNYRAGGGTLELIGKEKVGERDAFALRLQPKAGPATRFFVDAETFMLLKTAVTVDVPELGGNIEQVSEFSDFRDADGIKVAFRFKSTNPAQTINVTLTELKHNAEIDDASFSKPALK